MTLGRLSRPRAGRGSSRPPAERKPRYRSFRPNTNAARPPAAARYPTTHGQRAPPADCAPPNGPSWRSSPVRPKLSDEIEEILVEGSALEEVFLLHRPSGLLIVQDIIAANLSSQAGTFLGQLYYFAFGLIDRIGCLAYMPMMWNDLPLFQSGIRKALDSGYTHVVGAHWGPELITPKQVVGRLLVLRDLTAGAVAESDGQRRTSPRAAKRSMCA